MPPTGDDSTVRVDLLYIDGCPSHPALLAHLRRLLDTEGVRAAVHQIRIDGPEHAVEHRFLGSPTLRVDGVDVDPAAASRTDYGLGCRLYRYPDGTTHPCPPDEWITRAVAWSSRAADHGR